MARGRQRSLAEFFLMSIILAFLLSTACICFPSYGRALVRLASLNASRPAAADLRRHREQSDSSGGKVIVSRTCSASLERHYVFGHVDMSAIPHVSLCDRCCVCEPELTEALLVERFYARGDKVMAAPPSSSLSRSDAILRGTSSQMSRDVRKQQAELQTPDINWKSSRQSTADLSNVEVVGRPAEDGSSGSGRDPVHHLLRPASSVTSTLASTAKEPETLCPVCRGCTHVLSAPQPYYVGFNMTFKALPHARQGVENYWACPTHLKPELCESSEGIQITLLSACNGKIAGESVSDRTSTPSSSNDECPTSAQGALVLTTTHARERILADICAGSVGVQASHAGCIASQLFPRSWLEHVDAVLPDSGNRIHGHVVASSLPRGVPLSRLVNHPWPWIPLSVVKRMDSEQLLTAAVLDVLLMNCNRGLDDITVEEEGANGVVRFELQNNMHMFGMTASGRRCATNSIFVPLSRSFRLATLGPQFVSGLTTRPRTSPHLAQLLDYRCHIPLTASNSLNDSVSTALDKLGTNYPPGIAAQLSWVVESSPDALIQAYGIQNVDLARRLRRRAKDMLRRGFEWTILHGDRSSKVRSDPEQTASATGYHISMSAGNAVETAGRRDNATSGKTADQGNRRSDGEEQVFKAAQPPPDWPPKCCSMVYDAQDGKLRCSSR